MRRQERQHLVAVGLIMTAYLVQYFSRQKVQGTHQDVPGWVPPWVPLWVPVWVWVWLV